MTTGRRVCALCGRMFVIVIPPGDKETERDRLCPDCVMLPRTARGDGRVVFLTVEPRRGAPYVPRDSRWILAIIALSSTSARARGDSGRVHHT